MGHTHAPRVQRARKQLIQSTDKANQSANSIESIHKRSYVCLALDFRRLLSSQTKLSSSAPKKTAITHTHTYPSPPAPPACPFSFCRCNAANRSSTDRANKPLRPPPLPLTLPPPPLPPLIDTDADSEGEGEGNGDGGGLAAAADTPIVVVVLALVVAVVVPNPGMEKDEAAGNRDDADADAAAPAFAPASAPPASTPLLPPSVKLRMAPRNPFPSNSEALRLVIIPLPPPDASMCVPAPSACWEPPAPHDPLLRGH